MFSKLNENTKYINLIIYILVILLFFGLFRFIVNTVHLVSETNQNNFAYTIKTRNSIEEIDKVVEHSDVNLDILAKYITLAYNPSKLHDTSYNKQFISGLAKPIEAILLNTPGIDGAWFQVNSELPFSPYTYSWYRIKDGKCIDYQSIVQKKEHANRTINLKDDSYYFTAVKNKTTSWSNIYIDTDLNVPMMTISKPVYINNKLIGVVGIDISVSNVKQMLSNMQKSFSGSDVFLLDKLGNAIIFELQNNKSDNSLTPDFKKIFNFKSLNNDAMREYIDSGTQKTAILITLSNNYHVVITFPNSAIYKGFSKLFKTVYLIFFLLVALSIFVVLSIREIRNVNKEVEDRAKKLEIVFDSSPNIIVLKDTNGIYKSCNSKFSTLLNISRLQLIGMSAHDVFSKELADQIVKMENIVIKTKKMLSYEACYPGIEGELYLRKYIIPLFDSNNKMVEILIIAVDITKNKIEQKILRQAKEAAERTTAMKSNFLANMSHEIRTPLNGVVGFIQLLKDTNLSYEQLEFVADAQKSSEMLLGIINDILDFSKIEAGKLQVENISFDLRSLVEDITLFANANAENKGLEVSSLICSDVPKRVVGDPGRIRQVLNNLLSNAIKFTLSGEIVIYVKQILEDNDTSFVCFEVKDTGIGIDEDKLNYIFEEFAQSDASMTRKYGGTGLGLAISQRLINLMDGSIHVKSTVGEGSTFTFTLPLKKDLSISEGFDNPIKTLDGAKILVIDDNSTDLKIIQYYLSEANCVVYEAKTCQDVIEIINRENDNISMILVDYKMQINCDGEFGCLTRENDFFKDIPIILYTSLAKRGDSMWAKEKGFRGYLTKPIKKSDLIDTISMIISDKNNHISPKFITKHVIQERKFSSKAKILVVEDSEINCKLINKIFENHGLYGDFAFNGKEAINAFNNNNYDLILMDCQMPIVDGYEATKQIRESEDGNQHIPIVAMTANALPKDREKCLSIGMDDYISKPLDINLLLEIISKYVPSSCEDNEENKREEISETVNDEKFDNIICKLKTELLFNQKEALELFIDYFEFLPNAIIELENASKDNNSELIRGIAHKIKGASANLRVEEVAQLSLELENAAKQNLGPESYFCLVSQMKSHLNNLNMLFMNYTNNLDHSEK